jgi:Ca2+/Na+ antiporter
MKMRYIVSRAALAAILGVALYAGGIPWWGAVAAGALALVFFLVVLHSGRYVVQDKDGLAPLRRDERSRAIRDKAARNSFVPTILSLAGLTMAYGRFLCAPVPVAALGGVLALAVLVYAASDLYLRRSS